MSCVCKAFVCVCVCVCVCWRCPHFYFLLKKKRLWWYATIDACRGQIKSNGGHSHWRQYLCSTGRAVGLLFLILFLFSDFGKCCLHSQLKKKKKNVLASLTPSRSPLSLSLSLSVLYFNTVFGKQQPGLLYFRGIK